MLKKLKNGKKLSKIFLFIYLKLYIIGTNGIKLYLNSSYFLKTSQTRLESIYIYPKPFSLGMR